MMTNNAPPAYEQLAALAFNKQAGIFDEIYAGNAIVSYKRARVRNHVLQYIHSKSNILELNAGTGDDAIYFASLGHTVHATDIAADMQHQLRSKILQQQLSNAVTTELCSYTALDQLKNKGPYDLIFSNFAGLNCTPDLHKVLQSFPALLKPGGIATMVIMPGFCLWEALLALKGNFKIAFRRRRHKAASAHIESVHFLCWYYSPRYLTRQLQTSMELVDVEGLCTIVPPSFLDKFPRRYPALLKKLEQWERRLKRKWPWKYIGDYYIITFRKPYS
jgi:ubiquinone/menaquinone biosynthesis C-methylase UbiE